MSASIKTAIRRIEHELALDRGRENLDIRVDLDRHRQLVERLAELQKRLAEERVEEMQILRRHAERNARKSTSPTLLTPMGMDETFSESERRANFGEPPRKLPDWL